MIRGRGTVCFHATAEGVEYAIKDAWTNKALKHNEAEMLHVASARNVNGVPSLVDEVVVQVQGHIDSTSWPRECIAQSHESWNTLMKLEVREHRRLVMTPFASPLITFKSKVELLTALRDAIQGD
jgi:hypothetical protein